jgi:O-antigen ligase
LLVLFIVRQEIALPVYLLVAGPSVALSLSGSGILSRLYIGNMLFFLITLIWLVQRILPNRKSGTRLLPLSLSFPLYGLIVTGVVSIGLSHLFPDPNVTYSFPHSNTSVLVVNAAELMILIGLPLFTLIVPGTIRTSRYARLVVYAYVAIGVLYALGTIFASQLGLLSKQVILGVSRPQVFGSISSALGTILILFTCIALGQTLYSRATLAKIIWGVLTTLFVLGTIMTFGRESWLGVFLAVVTIIIAYTKNWKILVVLALLPLPILLIPGVTDFFDPQKTYGADRLKIWVDAITIWQHSPLIGVGAGNYQFFDNAYGTDVVGVAHNQYLQVLAEMGILGFSFLLWLMGSVGWLCLRAFRKAKTPLAKSISIAYLGYFAAIVLGGFFTSSFIPSAADGGGTAAFVESSYRWLLFGLVLSIPNWETPVEA